MMTSFGCFGADFKTCFEIFPFFEMVRRCFQMIERHMGPKCFHTSSYELYDMSHGRAGRGGWAGVSVVLVGRAVGWAG